MKSRCERWNRGVERWNPERYQRDEIQRVQRVERGDDCQNVVEILRERNEIEYWNESDEKRGGNNAALSEI